MAAKFNIAPIEQEVYDELAGTGLQFAVVIWRPGFMGRGDPVAVATRSKNPVEVADALMKATDEVTSGMARETTG